MTRESDLRLGVFAIRMGLVTPDDVMAAAAACLDDDSKDIADHLVALGELSASSVALLRGLAGGGRSADSFPDLTIPKEKSFGLTLVREVRPVNDGGDQATLIELPGRYVREREYARGGMGQVKIVHDNIVGRDLALKEILDDPDHPAQVKAELERRFFQEARITGQLEHPSIVPVYELGRRAHGRPYYVMKLVHGTSLRQVIKKSKSLQERLKLLPRYLDLCQAIAYAHSRGIIHRDIKSANVLLGQFGETAVIDWGLAKSKYETDHHAQSLAEAMKFLRAGDPSVAIKTAYGTALGTPAYMSPEQAAGELDHVDERSDIYSLGAVLFEILTGRVLFDAPTLAEVVAKVSTGEREQVLELEPEAPPELVRICERALARDPSQRYQQTIGLLSEIESFHNVWQADESLRKAYRELQETHEQLRESRENELRALADVQRALERAERDLYLASIQLAANRISEHRFDLARGALAEAPERERHWEWGYLVGLAFPNAGEQAEHPEDPGAAVARVAEAWRGAVARERISLKAHGAYVTSASLSLDGTRLLTSSADGSSKLWEFPTARLLNTFSEGADVIQGAALSHGGGLVATTRTYHSKARVWSAESGAEMFELDGHREPVGEIRFSWDDSLLLTAAADHTAKLWSVGESRSLVTLAGHEAPLFDARFSSDATRVVTAGADGTVRRWDVSTGVQEYTCKITAEKPLVSARLSDCLQYVLCACSDGSGFVWHVDEGRILSQHIGRIGRLDRAGFSSDSSCFVAPSAAGGACIRDTETGEVLASVGDRHEILHAAVFAPGGFEVLTGSVDGAVKFWSPAAPGSMKQRGVLRGHTDVVYFADFSPDSTRLVTASYDQGAIVWDATTGGALARLEGHEAELQSALFTADGRYIVTGSWDLTRVVWDAGTFEKLLTIPGKRTNRKAEFFGGARSEYNLGNSAILGRAIGADSRMLLVRDNQLSHDGWDIVAGQQKYTLSGHTKPLTTQAFSRCGRFAVTGSMSGESIVWRLQDGVEVVRLRGHRAGITFADFDPAGTRLITSSLDRTAIIWDLSSGAPLLVLQGHNGLVKTARFSPCGTRALTSSVDTTAIVWDTHSGKRLSTLIGHRGRMLDAMFSPDGGRLLTADYEMARVWDLEGHELVALSPETTLMFATWSPDGRRIVTCDKNGSARIWSSLSWSELAGIGEGDLTLERRLQLRRDALLEKVRLDQML